MRGVRCVTDTVWAERANFVASIGITIKIVLFYDNYGTICVNGILGIRAVSPFVVYQKGGDQGHAMKVGQERKVKFLIGVTEGRSSRLVPGACSGCTASGVARAERA